MRKLVLSMFVSVDGYINGVGGEFVPPEWSSDLDRWTADMVDRFDTLIYGRSSWQEMAAYWPAAETAAEAPEPHRRLATFMNNARKIVFSRSLTDASSWSNSVIATKDLVDVVSAERNAGGKDMVMFAGARLAQTALRADVIDEYSLLTVPVVLGGGTRLFENHHQRTHLELLEVRPMDTGAVLTRYQRRRDR